MPPSVGDRLGPYELTELIGSGGMGEVYRGRDTRLRRNVAVKILAHNRDAVLLEREARCLAKLNHPNLLTIYDVGRENESVYIVTELIEGQSLRAVLQNGALPCHRALGIAAQIADGLAAAHKAGIIHRDLKPENVMITPEGTPRILDFGIARSNGTGKPETTVTLIDDLHFSGTLPYMAPEQVRGECSERTDIWALGAVLYELLSGRSPFERATPADTISAILNEEPLPLPSVTPAAVTRVVFHCLEKNAEHRFHSAQDTAFSLRNVEPASAGTVPDSKRKVSGPPSIFTWCAAGLIALAAGYIIRAALDDPGIDYARLRYRPLESNVGPAQPSWSADGKLIAYSGATEGIFLRNLDNPSATMLTRHWGWPVLAPDGRRVYYVPVGFKQRDVWAISTAGGEPERLFANVGGAAVIDGIAISPDGTALAILRQDPATKKLTISVSSPPGAALRSYPGSPEYQTLARASLRFSPDGTKLLAWMAAAVTDLDVWVLPWSSSTDAGGRKGRKILQRWKDSGILTRFDWMPDSRHVIAGITNPMEVGGQLWMADTESERVWPISPGAQLYWSPASQRTSGRVAFGRAFDEEDIFEIPVDGSEVRPMVATHVREQYPEWSPQGDQFVYVTERSGRSQIWLSSRDRSWERAVVTEADLPGGHADRFVAPTFSPDGQRIAFSANERIWISRLNGGAAIPIRDDLHGRAVGWSPDGQWIACACSLDAGKLSLVKLRLGSNEAPQLLVDELSYPSLPRWSPDGSWITAVTSKGLILTSPDGASRRVVTPDEPGFGAAWGWSRNGQTLYFAHLSGQDLILSAFDVAKGTAKVIANLRDRRFSHFIVGTGGLSMDPSGKTLAGSFWRVGTDLWLLEGLQPPGSFWRNLLPRR